MKKIAFIIVCALFLGNYASMAQTVKLGYVNSGELLRMMPEMVKADSNLQQYAKGYEDQIAEMYKEYQTKVQTFQNQEKTMTEAVKEVRFKEIQQLEQRITDIQKSAQEKIEQKREELLSPVIKKAEDAIKAVGEENNYSYIFDTSAGSILYSKDADNILTLVKAKLGIK